MVEELKDWLVLGGLQLVVAFVGGGGQAEGHLTGMQVPQQLLGTCMHVPLGAKSICIPNKAHL